MTNEDAVYLDQLAEIRRATYAAAAIAESAWTHELERVYGEDAGEARFDPGRNRATPRLAALRRIKQQACDVWHAANALSRSRDDVAA